MHFPHQAILCFCMDVSWASHSSIQFSDTIYPESVQTLQVQGSVLQDCPHFRCRSQVRTSHTSDRLVMNWGSHHPLFTFDDLQEWLTESGKHFT